MFNECKSLENIDFPNFNLDTIRWKFNIFRMCPLFEELMESF